MVIEMKVCIITLYNNINFGNRLQNYALQECIKSFGVECETIKNGDLNLTRRLRKGIKLLIKPQCKNEKDRYKEFKRFGQLISCNKKMIDWNSKKINLKYDYYITGSDQVWNPQFNLGNRLKFNLLSFAPINKRISYAASFGQNSIDSKYDKIFLDELKKYKSISVRENQAVNIIHHINKNANVEVVLDPTMLLNVSDWEKIMHKPKKLKKQKYILNYFLGELSDKIKEKINDFAELYDCEVINLMDKKSILYSIGPDNFLYLEKNAFLICTDSFHSSVFAILFNRPFIVFDRKQDSIKNMNSRIDTLLEKFHLEDRKYNENKLFNEYLLYDYSNAYSILDIEKTKSYSFIKNSLDIK